MKFTCEERDVFYTFKRRSCYYHASFEGHKNRLIYHYEEFYGFYSNNLKKGKYILK